MGTIYYLLLGVFTVFTLSILLTVMLNPRRRYNSLIVAATKQMGKYHLEFYALLESHELRFENPETLYTYFEKLRLLKQADYTTWQRITDIDAELLLELFYTGDSCITNLLEGNFLNKEKYHIPLQEFNSLKRYYWKIRLLIHLLPQVTPAQETAGKESRTLRSLNI